MTTYAQARKKADYYLTQYRRAQIRFRYGQATVADIDAAHEDYKAVLAEFGQILAEGRRQEQEASR